METLDDWLVAITDITPTVHRVRDLLRDGDERAAAAHLPVEQVYPLPVSTRGGTGCQRISAALG